MTAPTGWSGTNAWNGYYYSVVGYQDQVTGAAGTNGTGGASVAAPTATISAGTIYCWNGLTGYSQVSASSSIAVPCAPLTLSQVMGGHTVTVTMSATTNPAVISRSPTSAAAPMTDVTAQVTPPSAIITYSVSVDGQSIAALTITVNLNSVEASASYALAPATGS
jgi:hypothetical protein